MDIVQGETSYSEICVTCVDDGTEEVRIKVEDAIDIKEVVSIKVEEAIDVKDEIPQAIIFPPIKTEQEVRLWNVCEVVAAHALSHLWPQKGNCNNTLNFFLLCVVLWVPCTF